MDGNCSPPLTPVSFAMAPITTQSIGSTMYHQKSLTSMSNTGVIYQSSVHASIHSLNTVQSQRSTTHHQILTTATAAAIAATTSTRRYIGPLPLTPPPPPLTSHQHQLQADAVVATATAMRSSNTHESFAIHRPHSNQQHQSTQIQCHHTAHHHHQQQLALQQNNLLFNSTNVGGHHHYRQIFGQLPITIMPINNNGEPIKLPDNLESLPRADGFPSQRHRWNTNEEIAAVLISFEKHIQWQSKEVKTRPKSGSLILYSRKKVRYRRDGYCWKKRKDGKTTREDHMKLKVQGTECIYGCYVHSAILPTFHRRCYWLLQNPDIVLVHYLNVPYPDDNKMAVIAPNISLWGDKKEWTKEELVNQLKPMLSTVTSDEDSGSGIDVEISTTAVVESIVSQLMEKQRISRHASLAKQFDCGCGNFSCANGKTCTHPVIRRPALFKSVSENSVNLNDNYEYPLTKNRSPNVVIGPKFYSRWSERHSYDSNIDNHRTHADNFHQEADVKFQIIPSNNNDKYHQNYHQSTHTKNYNDIKSLVTRSNQQLQLQQTEHIQPNINQQTDATATPNSMRNNKNNLQRFVYNIHGHSNNRGDHDNNSNSNNYVNSNNSQITNTKLKISKAALVPEDPVCTAPPQNHITLNSNITNHNRNSQLILTPELNTINNNNNNKTSTNNNNNINNNNKTTTNNNNNYAYSDRQQQEYQPQIKNSSCSHASAEYYHLPHHETEFYDLQQNMKELNELQGRGTILNDFSSLLVPVSKNMCSSPKHFPSSASIVVSGSVSISISNSNNNDINAHSIMNNNSPDNITTSSVSKHTSSSAASVSNQSPSSYAASNKGRTISPNTNKMNKSEAHDINVVTIEIPPIDDCLGSGLEFEDGNNNIKDNCIDKTKLFSASMIGNQISIATNQFPVNVTDFDSVEIDYDNCPKNEKQTTEHSSYKDFQLSRGFFTDTLDISQEDAHQTLMENMPSVTNTTIESTSKILQSLDFMSNTCLGNDKNYEILASDAIRCNRDGENTTDNVFGNINEFDMMLEFPELDLDNKQSRSKSDFERNATLKADNGKCKAKLQQKYTDDDSKNLKNIHDISDFSPEWSYPEGGVKVLVVGPWTSNVNYSVMFDTQQVPAVLIQNGVLRCYCPAHEMGFVTLQVYSGGFVVSNSVTFEYKTSLTQETSLDNISNDCLYKFTLLNRLSAIDEKMQIRRETRTIMEQQFLPMYTNFEEKLVNYCHLLMKRSWLSNSNTWTLGFRAMSLLHLASALGYSKLVCAMLNWRAENSSIILETEVDALSQDAHGYTPMAWACAGGHVQTATILYNWNYNALKIRNNANQTPLDIAELKGHKTLLSELFRLEYDRHKQNKASFSCFYLNLNKHSKIDQKLPDFSARDSAIYSILKSPDTRGNHDGVFLIPDKMASFGGRESHNLALESTLDIFSDEATTNSCLSPQQKMDFALCEGSSGDTSPLQDRDPDDSVSTIINDDITNNSNGNDGIVGDSDVKVLTLAEHIIAAMPERIKNEADDMMMLGSPAMNQALNSESKEMNDHFMKPLLDSLSNTHFGSDFNDNSYRSKDMTTPCLSLSPASSGTLQSPASHPLPGANGSANLTSQPSSMNQPTELMYTSNIIQYPFEFDFSKLTLTDTEQLELYEAAKCIQKAYRSYKGRQKLEEQKKQRTAAILIQNYYRRYKEYAYFKQMTNAAIVIQNRFRTYYRNKLFKKSQATATIGNIDSAITTGSRVFNNSQGSSNFCDQQQQKQLNPQPSTPKEASPSGPLKRTYSQSTQNKAARKIQQFMRQSRIKGQEAVSNCKHIGTTQPRYEPTGISLTRSRFDSSTGNSNFKQKYSTEPQQIDSSLLTTATTPLRTSAENYERNT